MGVPVFFTYKKNTRHNSSFHLYRELSFIHIHISHIKYIFFLNLNLDLFECIHTTLNPLYPVCRPDPSRPSVRPYLIHGSKNRIYIYLYRE